MKLIDDLDSLGVNMEAEKNAEPLGDSLAGKSFVVTGTLSMFTRSEIQELIKQHGGKASSSVSAKTDFFGGRRKSR